MFLIWCYMRLFWEREEGLYTDNRVGCDLMNERENESWKNNLHFHGLYYIHIGGPRELQIMREQYQFCSLSGPTNV